MKKLLIIKLVFCVMLLTAIQSCKDDCENPCNKDCETYNPCDCETPLKADFVMEEKVWDRWFEIGSPIWAGTMVRYRVTTLNFDSCIWILGTETLQVAEFSRKNYPPNSIIRPMLIVYKSVNPKCTGKFKAVDTLVRSFSTANSDAMTKQKAWQMYGSFKGYKKSNPSKEVIITIDTVSPTYFYPETYGTHITNFPYDNYNPPKYFYRPDGTPYQAINYFPFSGSASFMSTFQFGVYFDGYGIVKNDELKIVYSYYKDTLANGTWDRESPILKDEFIGQRIK
jgi:hypothetical protein